MYKYTDIETIRRLYVEEKLTMKEVGQRIGITGGAVQERLRRAGIPRRSQRDSRQHRVTRGDERLCAACKEWKKLDLFKRDKRHPNGRAYRCMECYSKDARARHILRDYNLTLEQYDALFQQQGGVCAICKRSQPVMGRKKNLHIDHDHATGHVRGLLCHSCNTAVGLLQDNPQLISTIIEYLATPSPRTTPAA